MKSFFKDIAQATIIAIVIGFPFIIYFYQMKP